MALGGEMDAEGVLRDELDDGELDPLRESAGGTVDKPG